MGNQAYEIHIKGQLNCDWAEWFEGMQMRCLENGEMILCGVLPDQAALMGVLTKLNRLNLAILSVLETGQRIGDGPDAGIP
jgi:hypothetical protein